MRQLTTALVPVTTVPSDFTDSLVRFLLSREGSTSPVLVPIFSGTLLRPDGPRPKFDTEWFVQRTAIVDLAYFPDADCEYGRIPHIGQVRMLAGLECLVHAVETLPETQQIRLTLWHKEHGQ